MNKKIALFIASPMEIREENILRAVSGLNIFYTGLGKIRAAVTAAEVLSRQPWDWAINLGTAGSHSVNVGTLVECHKFVERDVDLTAAKVPAGQFPGASQSKILDSSKVFTDLPKVVCGTGDRIEVSPPKVSCDVYDMEAYALAFVCQRRGVPYSSIKYISDRSEANLLQEWKSEVKNAEKKLIDFLSTVPFF